MQMCAPCPHQKNGTVSKKPFRDNKKSATYALIVPRRKKHETRTEF